MSEDPKVFMRRTAERSNQEAIAALGESPGKTCVFCAEPELDCNPLYRLRADLFICADPANDFASLYELLPRRVEQTPAGPGLSFIGCYSQGAGDPNALVREPDLRQLLQLKADESPEVRMIELRRTVGSDQREFWVLGVGLEAARVYKALFVERGLALKYLCLFPGVDNSWSGTLARLVQANADAEPEFVISSNASHDWPWAQLWQAFNNWAGMVTYALRDRPLDQVVARGSDGRRTVRVRGTALTPATIGEARIAHITVAAHQQYHWPRHIKLLVEAPPEYEPDPRTYRLNPTFDTVTLSGLPLKKALVLLQRKCLDADRVATIRLGFEDEGPELNEWRREPGAPLELTIYCEHEGDVVSFGPYADVIQ
jgi:hypothetical protein